MCARARSLVLNGMAWASSTPLSSSQGLPFRWFLSLMSAARKAGEGPFSKWKWWVDQCVAHFSSSKAFISSAPGPVAPHHAASRSGHARPAWCEKGHTPALVLPLPQLISGPVLKTHTLLFWAFLLVDAWLYFIPGIVLINLHSLSHLFFSIALQGKSS